jgi:hypothetical protein
LHPRRRIAGQGEGVIRNRVDAQRAITRCREQIGDAHLNFAGAQQERCTDRTIANRIDRSMAAILAEFLDTETDVERCQATKLAREGRLSCRSFDVRCWQMRTFQSGHFGSE